MAFVKEILILFVVLNIASVHGNLTGLRPVPKSMLNGFLSRQNNFRFSSVRRPRLRRPFTLRQRLTPAASITSSVAKQDIRKMPSMSPRRTARIMKIVAERVIKRLRHPLTCGKGRALVCGKSNKGLTIQKCYSNCGRKSCVVPCVCACFKIPKRGFLRPIGQSFFLPLDKKPKIPMCKSKKDILRCTAKQKTIATSSQCSSACMAGICPATCRCDCIDESQKGIGLKTDSHLLTAGAISGGSGILSPLSRTDFITKSRGLGGSIIVEGSPALAGGVGAAATETETIDVKIDVVKGGETGGTGTGGVGKDGHENMNGFASASGLDTTNSSPFSGNNVGMDILGGKGGGVANNAGDGSSLPNANALGINDPVVLLDPTMQNQAVGKIPLDPNDPAAPAGLSPTDTSGLNTALDNLNPLGGDLLSRAMDNLGGNVDFLDPDLASMLPMALGQIGADQSAQGTVIGGSNTAGLNNGGINGVNGLNAGAISDVAGFNSGLNGVEGLNSGGLNDVGGLGAKVLHDLSGLKSGVSSGGGLNVGGINDIGGLSPASISNVGAINVGNSFEGFNAAGLNNMDAIASGMLNSNTGKLNEFLGSNVGSGNLNSLNSGNSNTGGINIHGKNGIWGSSSSASNSDGIHQGSKPLSNPSISTSGSPPAISSEQSNDYCLKTGRRMWCTTGTTWKSTPGLTEWCNINCPSGSCDVERCSCNCVAPHEYELNFKKHIGFK